MERRDLEKAWSLILKSHRIRCKDNGCTSGFSMFSFRDRICSVPMNMTKKFNCIYRFIPKGSYFWNSFLDINAKLFASYQHTKVYIICISLPPSSEGSEDEIVSIKMFDNITGDEIKGF